MTTASTFGIGQQFAVIHVGFRLRIEAALETFLPMRPINIANRRHLDVGGVGDGLSRSPPRVPNADAAHADGPAGPPGRSEELSPVFDC
jgi:hypothetical protein